MSRTRALDYAQLIRTRLPERRVRVVLTRVAGMTAAWVIRILDERGSAILRELQTSAAAERFLAGPGL